jgi:hypothetical protein
MADSNKPPQRDPVGATVDSVVGAIGLLWDWLGDPPKKSEPSILKLLEPDATDASEAPTEPAPKPDGVIDTEGNEV